MAYSSFIKRFLVGYTQLNLQKKVLRARFDSILGSGRFSLISRWIYILSIVLIKKSSHLSPLAKKREIKLLKTRAWALAWFLLDLSFTSGSALFLWVGLNGKWGVTYMKHAQNDFVSCTTFSQHTQNHLVHVKARF